MAIVPDLQGINGWRYRAQISPGVQELVEALSFQHYLVNKTMITIDEAQKMLPQGMLLTAGDYLLGIFDMVGELMRFVITTLAVAGLATEGSTSASDNSKNPTQLDILIDMRRLRSYLEALDTTGSTMDKEVERKREVMKSCVDKVEMAVCGMIVRGRERSQMCTSDGTQS